jgi:hypothetical protein
VHQAASAALPDHLANRCLRAVEGSCQINPNHPVPIFGGAFKNTSELNDSGIVYQNVDATELLNAARNDRGSIFTPAHISTKRFGLAAGCAYLSNRLFSARNIFVRDKN